MPAVAVVVGSATVILPIAVDVSIVVPPVAEFVVSTVAVSPVAAVVVGPRRVHSSLSCPPSPCHPLPSASSLSLLCPLVVVGIQNGVQCVFCW